MDDELEPLWPSSHPLVDNGRSVGNGASPFRGCHNQCFAGMFEISIFGEIMMPASNRQPSHSRTLSRSERSAIAPLRVYGGTGPHQDRDRENGRPYRRTDQAARRLLKRLR